MKKSFLLPFVLSSLLFASCSQSTPNPDQHQSEKEASGIELGNHKTNYTVGDSFSKPTVFLLYKDSTEKDDISDKAVCEGYNLDVVGTQTVRVSYLTFKTSYSITVSPKDDQHDDKTLVDIEIGEKKTDYHVGDTFVKPVVIALYDDDSEENVTSKASFIGYDLSTTGTQVVTVSYENKTKSYSITVSPSNVDTFEIDLATTIGNESNLNGYSTVKGEYFTFSFMKNDGQSPLSTKDGDDNIRLYDKNSMTISSIKEMTSITFMLFDKVNTFTVDVGEVDVTNSVVTWTGKAKSVTFTSVNQNRFNNLKIRYILEEDVGPDFGEVTTIKEVLDAAKDIEYLPNDAGWYCTNYTVSLDVLAIDTIDSVAVSTTSGYDPDARGKILAMDDTGYMILSSSTDTNPKMSFFQKVKKYLKSGATTYRVKGKIAFLNGVTEVKVEEYEYDDSLAFTKSIDDFKVKTLSGSEEFATETITKARTNAKGYGVNDLVEIKGLTYFNMYNKEAGSYLFVDQEGQLIPVFSALNKDKSALEQGKCYDIVGLESMYNGRPSFRIESVHLSESEPQEFDFENSTVKLTDLNPIYEIGENSSAYPKSEFNLYSVDAYVSTYFDGSKTRYTFNSTYFKVGNKYTTGTNENDSATKKSLDVFNVDEIDYNQSLINYVIDDCTSDEEVESMKVTLYFTLTRLETVNHLNRWRVNVIEDLIFSLDYYNAKEASMTFDVSKAQCDRVDGEYQTWSNNDNALVVTNRSTSEATIAREVNYLKVVDGTKLTISFDKEIVGFTLYKGSYSYVAGLGDLEIEAYKQFAAFFTVKLLNPTKTIEIDPLYVSATGNTSYLKVTSITVKYLEA